MLVFLHEEYLWAVGLVSLVVFLLYLFNLYRKRAWMMDFGRMELLLKAGNFPGILRNAVRGLFISLAVAGLALVLLGPQWLTQEEQYEREGLEIVFALDVSLSMLAEDVKPNRLQRAKAEISNLVSELKDDRVGIVVFAGKAFSLLPYLTQDYERIFLRTLSLINERYARFVPYGTNIGNALLLSLEVYSDKPNEKVLILLTDGEEQIAVRSQMAEAVKLLLEKKHISLYMVGIGDPSVFSRIPHKDSSGQIVGFEKDIEGKIIETCPNPSFLNEIAQLTGGKYTHDATGDELKNIFRKAIEEHRKVVGIKTRKILVDLSRHFLAGVLTLLSLALLV
ncbi:MAG TPA: vWA domain-containing protein [Candidatus Hypogeohydataceae bacterium YC41]